MSIAALMLTHGLPKLLKLFGEGPISFSDPLGVGVVTSMSMAVFAECFCSMLLILGLATRLATIPLLITMSVAILMIHAQDPFGKKELPLLYMLIYITIGILGAGKYSVDHWLTRKGN